jgi:hypothetical protein
LRRRGEMLWWASSTTAARHVARGGGRPRGLGPRWTVP